jgi:hypothetical protein
MASPRHDAARALRHRAIWQDQAGEAQQVGPASDVVPVLSCPVEARIISDPATVTWTEFAQPHRRARDYQGLGAFVFDRAAYERAVREAVAGSGQ